MAANFFAELPRPWHLPGPGTHIQLNHGRARAQGPSRAARRRNPEDVPLTPCSAASRSGDDSPEGDEVDVTVLRGEPFPRPRASPVRVAAERLEVMVERA